MRLAIGAMISPRIPPKSLQRKVMDGIEGIEPLRNLGHSLEVIFQPDGGIEISGPIQSRLLKDAVLRSLHEIPGVTQVIDGIIADPDLELAVAQILAKDEQGKDILPGQIVVRSHLGTITLLGKGPANVSRDDLIESIRSIRGVRVVDDKLTG
jgi:hypothetical protein